MKEYIIKITGEYDILVLSPEMIALLMDKIRQSDTKELVIPAEEILPQGYAEYLTHVLEANPQIARNLLDRNAYTLLAGQIRKMQFNEKDCFDSVEVTEAKDTPLFDIEASEDFFVVTKHENNHFRYVLKTESGEEISIVLEFL